MVTVLSESITYSWKEVRAPKKITYDDFQLIPYDGLGHHLIKGVHIITPAPSSKHQWVSTKLSRLLGNFLEKNNVGEVIVAPYDVKFSEDSGFQPDLIIIEKENYKKIKQNYFDGVPLLIIEILSPGSKRNDYVWKREMAEEYKVPEYWVFNIEEKLVDLFYLEEEKYVSKTFEKNQKLVSTLEKLQGLEIELQELFDSLKMVEE